MKMQLTNLFSKHFTTNKLKFVRYYRKSSKFNLELNKELEEIIIGLMLGDLFAEKASTKSNTRLQFKQSNINKEYINHLYILFKEYCGSKPKTLSYFDNRPNKINLIFQLNLIPIVYLVLTNLDYCFIMMKELKLFLKTYVLY